MPSGDDETFILRPGPFRVVMLSVGLVTAALVFLFMAAVAAAIDVDSVPARLALLLLSLFLVALAVYFLVVLRTTIIRIEVGPERLKIRVPRLRGPLPLFSTIRADLPYDAIAAVETREEIYVSFGLTTVQRSYCVVTRDGVRLLLGVMAENWGAQMRYDQTAARIAERGHLSVIDRGAVRVGGVFRAMIRDVPPWSTVPITPAENKAWHRRAALSIQIIVLLAAATAVLRSCFGS